MKALNEKELKSIKSFFKSTQKELLEALPIYLKDKYDTIYATNEYIIAVGDIPIGLVAHLDTIFEQPPKNIFYDKEEGVMWSPEGLGADDRAGVYSIIQIIIDGFRPTIIFTTDEEYACYGADFLTFKIPVCPTELKYLIQLDRHGSKDCVFYNCNNKVFKEYIESFGFITEKGLYTDISVLCPDWDIAGVNLSIGYYNEHKYVEYLNIDEMFNTIEKVKIMLNDVNNIEKFNYFNKNNGVR